MGADWSDPQFWVVTAAAVAALWRVARALGLARRRQHDESPCNHCALQQIHQRQLDRAAEGSAEHR